MEPYLYPFSTFGEWLGRKIKFRNIYLAFIKVTYLAWNIACSVFMEHGMSIITTEKESLSGKYFDLHGKKIHWDSDDR